MFADLALPPRQVLHCDGSHLCHHRADRLRGWMWLLCLHEAILQLPWQSTGPPQRGECAHQNRLDRLPTRLWRWECHWKLRPHKNGLQWEVRKQHRAMARLLCGGQTKTVKHFRDEQWAPLVTVSENGTQWVSYFRRLSSECVNACLWAVEISVRLSEKGWRYRVWSSACKSGQRVQNAPPQSTRGPQKRKFQRH